MSRDSAVVDSAVAESTVTESADVAPAVADPANPNLKLADLTDPPAR